MKIYVSLDMEGATGIVSAHLAEGLSGTCDAARLAGEAGMWKRLNDLTRKVGGSIEQLMDYRSALISAAVTGKIDVRKETQNE